MSGQDYYRDEPSQYRQWQDYQDSDQHARVPQYSQHRYRASSVGQGHDYDEPSQHRQVLGYQDSDQHTRAPQYSQQGYGAISVSQDFSHWGSRSNGNQHHISGVQAGGVAQNTAPVPLGDGLFAYSGNQGYGATWSDQPNHGSWDSNQGLSLHDPRGSAMYQSSTTDYNQSIRRFLQDEPPRSDQHRTVMANVDQQIQVSHFRGQQGQYPLEIELSSDDERINLHSSGPYNNSNGDYGHTSGTRSRSSRSSLGNSNSRNSNSGHSGPGHSGSRHSGSRHSGSRHSSSRYSRPGHSHSRH